MAEILGAIAGERGVPGAQVALAWLLRNPVVTAPIIGVTALYQLDQPLGAFHVNLTDDEVRRLE